MGSKRGRSLFAALIRYTSSRIPTSSLPEWLSTCVHFHHSRYVYLLPLPPLDSKTHISVSCFSAPASGQSSAPDPVRPQLVAQLLTFFPPGYKLTQRRTKNLFPAELNKWAKLELTPIAWLTERICNIKRDIENRADRGSQRGVRKVT